MSNINVALVGNPNSGKTTLFNAIIGSKHYVGNWAGVTVEKKEGKISHKDNVLNIVDLPGIYSLDPYSIEEKVSNEYISSDEVDVILNILDATSLERNLYLTTQIIEKNKPVVIALNMMDEADKKNVKIDLKALSKRLGVPVLPIAAIKKEGIKDVLDEIIKESENKSNYEANNFVGLDVEKEKERFVRYQEVSAIAEEAIHSIGLGNVVSDKIDKVLVNKLFGLPIFAVIMAMMFQLTFTVGGYFADILDGFFGGTLSEFVTATLTVLEVHDWMISLIVDGVIGGVGGVLVFVPNIAIMFLLITLLEDSGYMSRAAFVMDFWMSRVGLNGKSFIPMILGFGCNVPAIMGTRTLENENDRLLAILINPFMSCAARLPIYILFSSVFFPGQEAIVTFSLYILGIILALSSAYIFRKTLFKGEESPFIMEFPPYRLPGLNSLGIHVWERVKGYIVKAGTVILGASIIIWVVLNYNMTGMVDISESFGASIGKVVAPMFKPLGFGTWEASVSLISGLVAKEIVVANMGILYGFGDSLSGDAFGMFSQQFTKLTAYTFMVFTLLYTPCVAVMGVIKRETNSWKWMWFSVFYQLTTAWVIAFLVYQVGSFIGL
jgi:ferrous iron transport protein B